VFLAPEAIGVAVEDEGCEEEEPGEARRVSQRRVLILRLRSVSSRLTRLER
jgi:hypothetical protein